MNQQTALRILLGPLVLGALQGGWTMFKMTRSELRALGVSIFPRVEFETDVLDLWLSRYRIVDVLDEVVIVSFVMKLGPGRSRPGLAKTKMGSGTWQRAEVLAKKYAPGRR